MLGPRRSEFCRLFTYWEVPMWEVIREPERAEEEPEVIGAAGAGYEQQHRL